MRAASFGRCPFGGALLLMEKAAARSDFPGEAGQRTGFQIDRWPVEWGGSPPMGEYICDASCVCAENRGAKEPATVVGRCALAYVVPLTRIVQTSHALAARALANGEHQVRKHHVRALESIMLA